MKKIGNFVCKNKWIILIISLILVIPAIIGYNKTRVNYDILVYLPRDIETLKGEKILTDDFHMGSFSIMIVENMADDDLLKLEDKIRDIDGVGNVISINDITGTTIPIEMLPNNLRDKVVKGNSKLVLTTFEDSANMYEDVKSGNAVACFEDYPVLGYAITQGQPLKMVGEMEAGNSYGFAVSKGKNAELIEKFNKGLKNLKDNGEYQKILDTYISK